MKITILSTFDTFGGASIAAFRLNKALNDNGLDSKMLVQDKKGKAPNVETIATNWFLKKVALARFAFDRYQFAFYEKSKAVRFIFSQAKIGVDISQNTLIQNTDIIHLHWINFGFLSLDSIQKLIATQKPIVWTLHDMWVFTGGCHYSRDCTHYQQSCGNCTEFLKNPSSTDLSNQVWKAKKTIFQNANITIVACSNWLAEKAKTSTLLEGKKIVSIPNPIDTSLFKPTEKAIAQQHFQLDNNKRYILFAAAKISDIRKGFIYFKEALEILKKEYSVDNKEVELIIFGQANANDFENLPFKVNVLGKLSDLSEIALAYSSASVFVVSSLEDNLPNTIMESLACGTPVVGFETGGIPEMIGHQKNGYLATFKSAEELAKGIFWTLFQADYQSLCQNSRQKALNNYAEEVVAKQYQALYESLL
ncbi:glycosyltransferase family 4 protein [Arcicella sp. DC2W]|uniref:Glycosyltransferase family 4 protein n=1 Tax=Arcicella gelida TaxID=2984195 RepID=A0ABU5RZZ3_9BACT|nr:glycosyltransferase family 4 protein [Arcicella sp. DC2W]MEA5401747.1 glycosyltransferase family 4 protein [Arcicella sp. DC2W]